MKITHYDLFAGIGGFSLALDTIFYDAEINHIFCEWEAFPTAVLKKHWPDGTYYGDIADLVADTDNSRRRTSKSEIRLEDRKENSKERQHSQHGAGGHNLTILTGGFPCQPFSHAGRRQGTADDRYLWPSMLEVIKNVRPDWVIAENVRGLVTWNDGMVLETVCADLESEGYEVQPLVIPAVAIGAPHRRDRVWIVAHAINSGQRREKRESTSASYSLSQEHREKDGPTRQFERANSDGEAVRLTADSNGQRERDGLGTVQEKNGEISERHYYAKSSHSNEQWAKDWREVAFASCDGSLDDGLPRDMAGLTISYAKYRREALKSVGNSIVPQVAMEIFRAIKHVL